MGPRSTGRRAGDAGGPTTRGQRGRRGAGGGSIRARKRNGRHRDTRRPAPCGQAAPTAAPGHGPPPAAAGARPGLVVRARPGRGATRVGEDDPATHFAASQDGPVAWYQAEASESSPRDLLAHLQRSLSGAFALAGPAWDSVDAGHRRARPRPGPTRPPGDRRRPHAARDIRRSRRSPGSSPTCPARCVSCSGRGGHRSWICPGGGSMTPSSRSAPTICASAPGKPSSCSTRSTANGSGPRSSPS